MKVYNKTVEVEKMVKVAEKVITIELSPEEAVILKALTGSIVGGGKVRILTDKIYYGIAELLTDEDDNIYFNGTLSTVMK